MLTDLRTELDNTRSKLNEQIKECDKMKEQNKLYSLSYSKIFSFRQILNILFFVLWEENETTLSI